VPHTVDESTVEHRLVFGWACYTRINRNGNWSRPQWYRFETGLQLWQWLEGIARPKKRTYTFCHNANFDWQATSMCQLMPSLGWSCEKAIIEDPPNYFQWRKDDKTLMMLDSTNYWPEALKKMGERIGLPKFDMPPDWSNPEQSDVYCRRDVEIVLRTMQDWFHWLKVNDLGAFAISRAGQAWSAYRHRFMTADIFIDDNEAALQLSRAAYIGGRTEAWQLNQELRDVTVLDVNALYPSVMRENLYPTKLIGTYKRVEMDELRYWLDKYCCVAEVTIDTDTPIYPERTKDGIMFPIGRFRTTLTTPELLCALDRGHLIECSHAAVYECAEIFTAFVDETYRLRLEYHAKGDMAAHHNMKHLMASLYGKFGQRGGHEEIIGKCEDTALRVETEIDIDSGKKYRIRYIAGVILCRSLDEETQDSFPAIAAHVTAYGRQILWQGIETAGISNVYYMDTDSLHVNAAGLLAMQPRLAPTTLGAYKVERKVARAFYKGAKDYTLDDLIRVKGVRAKATKVKENVYEQEQWVSLRGSCTVNHTGGPLVRTVQKHLKRIYRKGAVAVGGRVSPFVRDSAE
jgi:DNA polymerase family B